MNKLIIPIIMVAILVLGTGAFSISQKPTSYEAQIINNLEDSPFGIFDPYEVFLDRPTFITRSGINEYLRDLDVRWVQGMPREDVGELDTLATTGVSIYSRIIPSPQVRKEGPDSSYKKFVRNIIRKYKDKIKYWEADTEPDTACPYAVENGEGWANPEKYAEFLKITYGIIKEECSDCKVVLGGLGGAEVGLSENSHQVKFLESVLEAGGGKYFDAFEFKQHYHKVSEYTELKNKMEVYGEMLAKYGIDIYKIPVFIETAMYNGTPVTLNDPPLPYQSEQQEAGGLLKTYVFGTANGIDKIFWNNVVERGPDQMNTQEIFNCYGPVNNPDNDGESHKKLSYYTYKLMIEKLEDSNWDSVQTIIDGIDNVCAYKFVKKDTGEPVYVAWWDYFKDSTYTPGDTITLTLNVGNAVDSVKIAEAVPDAESGASLNPANYPNFFKTDTKIVTSGAVAITLRENPVFVEEAPTTSVEEVHYSNRFCLLRNYPNPFNLSTNIRYSVTIPGQVELKIYSLAGQLVKTLVDEQQKAGSYGIEWNGRDESGTLVLSGVYFYKLKAGDKFLQTKKLLLLRLRP